ncbi:hypothetical protein KEM48_009402 [Puccinia striiformis f. sp. tritici PST-130]|nr:hypothetical protein KEM48_009402 [Puccinia striiformis f. sp. tritici PST-130]
MMNRAISRVRTVERIVFNRISSRSISTALQLGRFNGLSSKARTGNHPPINRWRQYSQVVDSEIDMNNLERVSDEVDVCIVGGGPSGLSAAIKLRQLAIEAGKGEDFRVIVIEKGAEVGSHILSGAVIETRALDELLPDWKILKPEQAESIGVEIYSGFAGSKLLYSEDGKSVKGVITNDIGLDKNNKPKDSFEPGMEFHAKIVLLAEGCHGSLSKMAIERFNLREGKDPQTYGLGIKEFGDWMYHLEDNLVSLGLVVGLDYPNPYLSPYQEFQRLKHHPLFSKYRIGRLSGKTRSVLVMKELKEVRNLRPSFHNPLGLYGGIIYSGVDSLFLKGRVPWTFHHKKEDFAHTKSIKEYKPIEYPAPDHKLSFDILTSVSRTGTNHAENQPNHLVIKPENLDHHLEINCKTCSIKVPTQDITWTVPEGGGGPAYSLLSNLLNSPLKMN